MRERNRNLGRLARIDEPAVGTLDRQGGQNARRIGPRVDPDTVRPLLHFAADCVAVDHDEPMVTLVAQERLADPSEVGLGLTVELDPGADPCVNQEIIAEAAGVGVETVRFYERRGLIRQPASNGGYRRYGDEQIELLERLAFASSKAAEGPLEPPTRLGWEEIPSHGRASDPLPPKS